MALSDPRRELFTLRMKRRVAKAHFHHDPNDPADMKRPFDDIEPLYQEIQLLEAAIATLETATRSECEIHDNPVYGLNNPPEPGAYIYHYTGMEKLQKIADSQSLRFGSFSTMNDPHEALDVHQHWMFARTDTRTISEQDSPPLTVEEWQSFRETDWNEEINRIRRQVKVGSFSMDLEPNLRDFEIDNNAPESVALRLHGSRGFAHPRMWAQYAADSSGVCLIFDCGDLTETFQAKCDDERCNYAFGPVTYAPAATGPRLRTTDIRLLLDEGARGAILANYETALLEKHDDWSHEAEYRFLVIDEPDEAFWLPITRDHIAGLIVGPKFDPNEHGAAVDEFLSRFEIRWQPQQLQWTHGSCELNRLDTTHSMRHGD